jgi:EmrB/QacA subfamily drug resistance transporter
LVAYSVVSRAIDHHSGDVTAVTVERPTTERLPWKALIAAAAGAAVGPLDGAIVILALPWIARDFHATPAVVSWVSSASFLVVSVLLLTAGRLADAVGYRRVYLAGLTLFVLGAAASGSSWSLGALIGFRIAQAAGSSMIDAVSPATAVRVFPEVHRGRALGVRQMMVATGLVSGPILGGVLLAGGAWRSVFFVEVPVVLVAGVSIWLWVPRDKQAVRHPFDVVGAALVAFIVAPVLVYLSQGARLGWGHPGLLLLLVLSPLAALGFAGHEGRTRYPLVEMSWFRDRGLRVAVGSALVAYASWSAVAFLVPFALTLQGDFPLLELGALVAIPPAVMMVTAFPAGALSDRIGARSLTVLGMGVTLVGILSLTWVSATTSIWAMAWRLMLVGAGFGMFEPPNISVLLGSIPSIRLGTAGGVLATVRNAGLALGVALGGALFGARLAAHEAAGAAATTSRGWLAWLHEPAGSPSIAAFRDTLVAAAILAAVASAVSALRPQRPSQVY